MGDRTIIMPAVPKWLTIGQAAALTGRAKRTIRLWLSEPGNDIRTRKVGGIRQLLEEDVTRVAERKDEYRESPTFGR